jgi:hypothetical protein
MDCVLYKATFWYITKYAVLAIQAIQKLIIKSDICYKINLWHQNNCFYTATEYFPPKWANIDDVAETLGLSYLLLVIPRDVENDNNK